MIDMKCGRWFNTTISDPTPREAVCFIVLVLIVASVLGAVIAALWNHPQFLTHAESLVELLTANLGPGRR